MSDRVSRLQRTRDLLIALPALLLFLPVMGAVACLVRVALGAPTVFRQERAGLRGRAFVVFKFRTMTDARGDNGELLSDDLRLTRIGRLLRSSSLDELPQLWNVVKGQMSLVGPRPLPMRYNDRYSELQRRRLEVRPGITGWAQVNGRNAVSWPERLALDVWYVDHRSMRLDTKILLLTVESVFGRHGVSAEGHATMPEFMGEH